MDFVSQDSLEAQSVHLPVDALRHEMQAEALLTKMAWMQQGSVVALQGSWGRGKTDVLARVARKVIKGRDGEIVEALWINPWQHGSPDLLTPVVIQLLRRLSDRPGQWNAQALWKASSTVIRAGLSFGLRAASSTMPGGDLLKEASKDADNLLKGLFEAHAMELQGPKPEPDPVDRMGAHFRALVEALLPSDQPKARLLICIDDMDRCLPMRQVALLEALRFMISAGARATFLVALDPTLLKQAVILSYGTEHFDPERYLDKMFDLRINLPSIAAPEVQTLVKGHQHQQVPNRKGDLCPLRDLLSPVLGDGLRHLETAATAALTIPELRNPRIMRRIFARLHLLACTRQPGQNPLAATWEEVRLLLIWLAMAERWPALRATCQDAGTSFEERLTATLQTLITDKPTTPPLPGLNPTPGLARLARDLSRNPTSATWFATFDRALVEAGL